MRGSRPIFMDVRVGRDEGNSESGLRKGGIRTVTHVHLFLAGTRWPAKGSSRPKADTKKRHGKPALSWTLGSTTSKEIFACLVNSCANAH